MGEARSDEVIKSKGQQRQNKHLKYYYVNISRITLLHGRFNNEVVSQDTSLLLAEYYYHLN